MMPTTLGFLDITTSTRGAQRRCRTTKLGCIFRDGGWHSRNPNRQPPLRHHRRRNPREASRGDRRPQVVATRRCCGTSSPSTRRPRGRLIRTDSRDPARRPRSKRGSLRRVSAPQETDTYARTTRGARKEGRRPALRWTQSFRTLGRRTCLSRKGPPFR